MTTPVLPRGSIARWHEEEQFMSEESDKMQQIYEIIFTDLISTNDVGIEAAKIVDLVQTSRDLFIETVNMIAAAAAITNSLKAYDTLTDLVVKLKPIEFQKPTDEVWRSLGFRIAEACLQRHVGQTNYFLFLLLNKKVFHIYVIYKFLRNQGAQRPLNTTVLLYFCQELRAFRESWFRSEWTSAISNMRSSRKAFLSCIGRDYRGLTTADQWIGQSMKRLKGLDSDLLSIVQADDVDTFVSRGINPKTKIEFSIFNQLFHFQYEFTLSDDALQIKTPSVMDAIGLFRAQKIFEHVIQTYSTDAPTLLTESIHSLIAGTTEEIQFARIAADDYGIDLRDTLRDAIRFHNNDLVQTLINDYDARFDNTALDAVFRFANIVVFEQYQDEIAAIESPPDSGERSVVLDTDDAPRERPPRPTIYHFMARGNSVHAFKHFLFADPTQIDPYAVATQADRRTFLHWAANYGAREVVRHWARLWGNRGFDALDTQNWNPAHYAFMTGLSDIPPPGQKGYGKYQISKPFYQYLFKRTDLEYDPDQDPAVEEFPDPALVAPPAPAPTTTVTRNDARNRPDDDAQPDVPRPDQPQ